MIGQDETISVLGRAIWQECKGTAHELGLPLPVASGARGAITEQQAFACFGATYGEAILGEEKQRYMRRRKALQEAGRFDIRQPIERLAELVQDLPVTFDPERSTAKPCFCCGAEDTPRKLVKVGTWSRRVGNRGGPGSPIMRPVCERCQRSR